MTSLQASHNVLLTPALAILQWLKALVAIIRGGRLGREEPQISKDLIELAFKLTRKEWNSRAGVIAQNTGSSVRPPDDEGPGADPLDAAAIGHTTTDDAGEAVRVSSAWMKPRYARAALLPVAVDFSLHYPPGTFARGEELIRGLNEELQSFLAPEFNVRSRCVNDPDVDTVTSTITRAS
jgi:hypothetical protein